MATLHIKRIYESPAEGDGYRVLVDRLWPRGMSKEKAQVDLWFKEIAPSTQARKEFGHMTERFADFTQHYRRELDALPDTVHQFYQLMKEHPVITLLFAAKDEQVNHAAVLREYLCEGLAAD